MTDHVGPEGQNPQEGPAAVQIVRGHPDDLEVAALVAGLAASAASAAAEEDGASAPEPWSDHGRRLPGSRAGRSPDAWRWSLRG